MALFPLLIPKPARGGHAFFISDMLRVEVDALVRPLSLWNITENGFLKTYSVYFRASIMAKPRKINSEVLYIS